MTTKKKVRKHAKVFTDEKITRDSFKDECDVKKTVERFARTGVVPVGTKGPGQFIDAPEGELFDHALVQAEVNSAFEDGFEPSEETPTTEKDESPEKEETKVSEPVNETDEHDG